MQERALRLRDRHRRVQAEPLERPGGVPDLDDRRPPPVRSDVDGQVGVVGDEQAGRLQVVHPAHEPDEVGQLAGQAVAVRLGQEHVPDLWGWRARTAGWRWSRFPSRGGTLAVARTTLSDWMARRETNRRTKRSRALA